MHGATIKNIIPLIKKNKLPLEQRLQNCTHGSPMNWSRIPWDPRNILWEPLIYKIQLKIPYKIHVCVHIMVKLSPTRCNNCVFILRNGFTLHVSGDNLTHHQEYNAVYGHR